MKAARLQRGDLRAQKSSSVCFRPGGIARFGRGFSVQIQIKISRMAHSKTPRLDDVIFEFVFESFMKFGRELAGFRKPDCCFCGHLVSHFSTRSK